MFQESPYRIDAVHEVLSRLNEVLADTHLRLVRIEGRDAVIDRSARDVTERALRFFIDQVAPKAADLEALVEGYRQGVSADNVAVTAERRFLSQTEIIDLQSRLTAGEVEQAIASRLLDVDGKLVTSVLPAIAINDTFPVTSQAAMLALTAQRGDVAVRSDIDKNFILATDSPGTLESWIELRTPPGAVLSVAGLSGAVGATQLANSLPVGTATSAAIAKFRDIGAVWGDFSGGVPWTSSPDVGPALNTAIAQFATAGGARFMMPAGEANLATTLAATTWKGVALLGLKFGDFGLGSTSLKWVGAANAIMIDWRSVPITQGSKLLDFQLNANGLAGKGLYARGLGNCELDIMCWNPTLIGADIDVIVGSEFYDVAYNDISFYFLSDTPASVNAKGLFVGMGNNVLDVHSNRFMRLRAQHQNGVGLDLGNIDTNSFYEIYAKNILGGTGKGVICRAGPSTLERARSNLFLRVDTQSGWHSEGTEGGVSPTENNIILYYSIESAAPFPTLGPGATLGGFDNRGEPIGNLALGGARKVTDVTPVATGGSGLVATGTCATRRVGRECDININFAVTNIGTGGSGFLRIPLPFTPLRKGALFGRFDGNGKVLVGELLAGDPNVYIVAHDNTYPITSTGSGHLSGRFETP